MGLLWPRHTGTGAWTQRRHQEGQKDMEREGGREQTTLILGRNYFYPVLTF